MLKYAHKCNTYHFFSLNRLSEGNKPFEARITIPRLTIRAKYSSSGVLIIIPASGAGDFDATLGKIGKTNTFIYELN